MSEVTNFTNPLSGHEVVEDILGQIRKRLYSDCSLRGEDGYSGGYFGSVAIKLKCNAVRTASIEMEFPITQSADVKAPGPDAFPPEDVSEFEIDETIKIDLEPNLQEVRKRTRENSAEAIKDAVDEPVEGAEPETTGRTKRRYTKRAAL